MATEFVVGTSGWHYSHWQGRFYPEDLPRTGWLEFYAQSFSSVEINNSFYKLPPDAPLTAWRNSTPEGFVFSVKASRFITHIKRLRGVEGALTRFLDRAKLLGDKLGPVLYQTPPDLSRNNRLLSDFLSLLPPGFRHVVEFRHESWFHEDVYELLRRHSAAFCIYNIPGMTTPVKTTAGFAYVRFHGSISLYGGSYSDAVLRGWAREIVSLPAKTVYVYFNNDMEGSAVDNALALRRMLEKKRRS